jgi:hypothetical protein
MKKSLLLCLGFVLLLGAATYLAAADVTGDWDLTTKSPRGERTVTVTFTQNGENLTVKMPGMRGGEPIEATGTVKGNDIEWSVTRSTPNGEFTITYKGTIDGDKMSGTTQMGERSSEWTAVRKAK